MHQYTSMTGFLCVKLYQLTIEEIMHIMRGIIIRSNELITKNKFVSYKLFPIGKKYYIQKKLDFHLFSN